MKRFFWVIALCILLNTTFALDLQWALKLSEDALSKSLSSSWGFVQMGNEETEDAMISDLHKKGITIHTTWEAFKPYQSIRRDEAAKMLTLSIPYLSSSHLTAMTSCEFSDANQAWDDLRDIIKQSCEKGLFKGSNGKFNPQSSITNGQILTVVWRMLYGMQDESEGHYAKKYIEKLENDGYLSNLWITESKWDSAAERGMLARLLARVLD